MNTAKILDILPHPTSGPTPSVTWMQPWPDARTVPAIGHETTADLIEKRAQRHAEAFAERRRAAKDAAESPGFNHEIGLVRNTFNVFVDLVSPRAEFYRVRIFGPPDNMPYARPPAAPTVAPASALAAYSAGEGVPPAAHIKADV
ncbi:MAG TPA: hypothetical protein VF342_00705 [Alphaproteobacteria bacterium]